MSSNSKFAEIAALAGDPARAAMCNALMDGRALTATELSRVAGVMPQTASGHLARMVAAGLLQVERQGRHRYHRLATAAVAHMLESIMQVAADLDRPRKQLTVGPRDRALRHARTCYDHLAGELGVALADALIAQGHVELDVEAGLVTDSGVAFLQTMGIDTGNGARGKSGRVLCRPCLDWSERRPHIAGAIGAALCCAGFDHGWIRRVEGTRAVAITPKGQRIFRDRFGAQMS